MQYGRSWSLSRSRTQTKSSSTTQATLIGSGPLWPANVYVLFCTVYRLTQHFDLVSERDVRQAREHVAAEIAPLLRELIVRAEDVLMKDERIARTLRNQASQELAQLEMRSGDQSLLGDGSQSPSVTALVAQAELDEQRRTLEKLQEERKHLSEKVFALEQVRRGVLLSAILVPHNVVVILIIILGM